MKMGNWLVRLIIRMLLFPSRSNGIKNCIELKSKAAVKEKLFSHESGPFKCVFPFVGWARESVRLRCKCRGSNGRPHSCFPGYSDYAKVWTYEAGRMVRHKGKVPTGQAAYDQYLDPSISRLACLSSLNAQRPKVSIRRRTMPNGRNMLLKYPTGTSRGWEAPSSFGNSGRGTFRPAK